jgi:hypothetical protein
MYFCRVSRCFYRIIWNLSTQRTYQFSRSKPTTSNAVILPAK